MPGWHEATKTLRAEGKLEVLGVIQEQHAQRCRLFAQWKGLDWPILQDAFNENGLGVVPVAVLIDEHGIVQSTRLRRDGLEKLLAEQRPAPANPAPRLDPQQATVEYLEGRNKEQPVSAAANVQLADALLKWKPDQANRAIKLYRSALAEQQAGSDWVNLIHFRIGVAERMLFDQSEGASTIHFQNAADQWSQALAGNPNQYIWRRRIQQYGPGLDKPYPFYDWVEVATAEIRQRGDEPVRLKVPLTGSEIASRQRRFQPAAEVKNPDPDGKITRDEGFVEVNHTIVPAQPKPGQTVRVYLHFQVAQGKWNNESTPLEVWLSGRGGALNRKRLLAVRADEATSREGRLLEFEFQLDKDAQQAAVTGFSLYNVCDSAEGACLFRRQDLEIPILK